MTAAAANVRMSLGFWSGGMVAMRGAVRCMIRSSFAMMIRHVSETFLFSFEDGSVFFFLFTSCWSRI